MGLSLALTNDVSVITLNGRSGTDPAWSRLLGWPAIGDDGVDFADPRDSARNHAAAKLDGAVRLAVRPVVLVAEGAACFAAAWWARLTPPHEVRRVAGALFFAPVERPRDEAEWRARFVSPDQPLPFPSLLLDGLPEDREHRRRIHALAREWGGQVAAQPRRLAQPLPVRSPWRQAQRLVAGYTARIVKRDIRLAHQRLR